VLGSNASLGFWLDGPTGNARFGNSISIGNQLTVGTGANIGGGLQVGVGANIGNNLIVGQSASIGAGLTVATFATIGANANIGGNLTVGNNASIGGNLNVSGLITTGNLLSNTVITNTVVPASINTFPIIDTSGGTFFGNTQSSGVAFALSGGYTINYASSDFTIVFSPSFNVSMTNLPPQAGTLTVTLRRTQTSTSPIWSQTLNIPASGSTNIFFAGPGVSDGTPQGLLVGNVSYRPFMTYTTSPVAGLGNSVITVQTYWTAQVVKR